MPEELKAGGGDHGSARERALGLLAVRWRSREELRRRLTRAGFPPDEVRSALQSLEAAGLVDDRRFAGELVRDRATRRLEGARAIRAALREKGVDPAVADDALADAGNDRDRALELASRRAARLSRLDPSVASRRLYGLLLRRGYGREVAREVVASVLPLDGEADGEADGDAGDEADPVSG